MNSSKDAFYKSVLEHNKGFDNIAAWIPYAKSHDFKKVNAQEVLLCPDCKKKAGVLLGKYIYYSNHLGLRECLDCKLIYADLHLAPEVIAQHFALAYKNEEYFLKSRERIFTQAAKILVSTLPHNAKVLDIGGAKGHLLAKLKELRPDTDLYLNDLSPESCKFAEETFGLKTYPGSIFNIDSCDRFSAILILDMLYYEPEIQKFWSKIDNLLDQSGQLLIRIPNRAALLKLVLKSYSFCRGEKFFSFQTKLPLFNPEHIFIFSQEYMKSRLKSLGFNKIQIIPSVTNFSAALDKFAEAIASSLGIVISPSIFFFASRE